MLSILGTWMTLPLTFKQYSRSTAAFFLLSFLWGGEALLSQLESKGSRDSWVKQLKAWAQLKQGCSGRAVKSLLHLLLRMFGFLWSSPAQTVPYLCDSDLPSGGKCSAAARVCAFPGTACCAVLVSTFHWFSTAFWVLSYPGSAWYHCGEPVLVQGSDFFLELCCWSGFVCGGCGWTPFPPLCRLCLAAMSLGLSSLPRVSKSNPQEVVV